MDTHLVGLVETIYKTATYNDRFIRKKQNNWNELMVSLISSREITITDKNNTSTRTTRRVPREIKLEVTHFVS
jgi:hypothetical protein